MGGLSLLQSRGRALASMSVTLEGAMTRSVFITVESRVPGSRNWISREVMIPRNREPKEPVSGHIKRNQNKESIVRSISN
jgi:hypothetical protein